MASKNTRAHNIVSISICWVPSQAGVSEIENIEGHQSTKEAQSLQTDHGFGIGNLGLVYMFMSSP